MRKNLSFDRVLRIVKYLMMQNCSLAYLSSTPNQVKVKGCIFQEFFS